MKKVVIAWLLMMCWVSSASASKLNFDPYFAAGATSLQAELGGSTSTSPSYYIVAGSALNWLSPNLGAEIRFGFGGQFTTFNSDINQYTSYLLKPKLPITRNLDIFALAGVSTMTVSISSTSSSDTDISYGAGFAYHIPDESLSLTVEWLQYRTSSDNSTTSISGMDISGISASFSFDYY
ncbi:MAG: outer membrane beta-barrel protein [Ghiorsea sp.]